MKKKKHKVSNFYLLASNLLIISFKASIVLSFKSLAAFSNAGVPFSLASANNSSVFFFKSSPFSLAILSAFSLSKSSNSNFMASTF